MEDQLQRELPQLLPRLWRFALRLTRSRADAEDLVQRCCLRALERRGQWQPGTALLSWLFAIMHSIWLNELRSAQRRREFNVDWEDELGEADAANHELASGSSNDPEHVLMCREIVDTVQALPEAQRLVMMLVVVEGLSYREAAQVLDVPMGTVMSRLARARLTVGERFVARSADGKGAQQEQFHEGR